MEFTPVKHNHSKVLIIGGGTSLKGFDFKQTENFDGAIITVNNVIPHLPRVDYWFTLDPMAKGGAPQPAMVNQREGTYYYCAFPDLTKIPNDAWYYKTVPNVHYLERIVPANGFALQTDKNKITTTDSIYGAIGLAYHFGAKYIAMLGVDVYGYGHWYDSASPYNAYSLPEEKFNKFRDNVKNNYRDCLPQLKAGGITIKNGSPKSYVDAFERMAPQKAYEWLVNV